MWHWLAVFTAPSLAHELEVTKRDRADLIAKLATYQRIVTEQEERIRELREGVGEMAQDNNTNPTQGMNVTAPVQKVVQVGLGQVASSLDAALGTLDALDDLAYHSAEGGIGMVHDTLETAINGLRAALKQAATDAATAVDQVGGVATIKTSSGS